MQIDFVYSFVVIITLDIEFQMSIRCDIMVSGPLS